MRGVNLLPEDAQGGGRSLREEDPAVVVGSVLGLVVMLALVASFLMAHSKVNAQQKLLDQARMDLATLSAKRKAEEAKLKPAKVKGPVTPIVPPPAITGQEATWLSSLSQVLGQRIAWDRLLREVSQVMPTDVTLTALTLTAPTPGAPPTAGQGFTITGNAFSYDSVARLLSRLQLVPDLSNVTLANSASGGTAGSGTSAPSTSSGGCGVNFKIRACVKAAGPARGPAAATQVAPADTTTGVGA